MPNFPWRFFTIFVSAQNLTSFVRAFISVAVLTVRLCLRIWCGRRRSSFSSLITATVARSYCVITETAWVSFGTLSMCLPLKTLSHFPLNVGFLSFLTLSDWSPFHNIVPDPEVLQTSSIVKNLSVHCFEQFLGRTKSKQSEAEQILPGSHLKACRLLKIGLDPIWREILDVVIL